MTLYTFTRWCLFFFFYCFAGWVWETCYEFVRTGHWEKRGFLHGPILPIYGFGALTILVFTEPARGNPWLIFLLGMTGATLLEYISGVLLEHLFHVRYWDYSHSLLNVNGHVCLVCSLVWGFFSILLVKWLHGWVTGWIDAIPQNLEIILALALLALFCGDTAASIKELYA